MDFDLPNYGSPAEFICSTQVTEYVDGVTYLIGDVPEPSTVALPGIAAAGLALVADAGQRTPRKGNANAETSADRRFLLSRVPLCRAGGNRRLRRWPHGLGGVPRGVSSTATSVDSDAEVGG